jgi:hypothetical protein
MGFSIIGFMLTMFGALIKLQGVTGTAALAWSLIFAPLAVGVGIDLLFLGIMAIGAATMAGRLSREARQFGEVIERPAYLRPLPRASLLEGTRVRR